MNGAYRAEAHRYATVIPRNLPALETLLARSDFRRSPFRAIGKRMWWRLRWGFSQKPWTLRMDDGSAIVTNKSGSGALIFYQGASEPEVSAFLSRFLHPGMVFVDAGAHIGEYTVRAARLVGEKGEVHAFEPAPMVYSVLEQSVALNGLRNVRLNPSALFDRDGTVEFQIDSQPTLSAIRGAGRATGAVIPVRAVRLDSYWKQQTRPINLIKVDVEGVELDVLRGASGLTSQPVWIFEYSSSNYATQGHTADAVLTAFREQNYSLLTWDGLRATPLDESALRAVSSTNIIAAPPDWGGV